MKSFAPKPWVVPQPVLIIGTYNKDGVANAMNAAWAGQWDMKEIMISMGNHVTTDNLKIGGEFTVAFATKKTMVEKNRKRKEACEFRVEFVAVWMRDDEVHVCLVHPFGE